MCKITKRRTSRSLYTCDKLEDSFKWGCSIALTHSSRYRPRYSGVFKLSQEKLGVNNHRSIRRFSSLSATVPAKRVDLWVFIER